MIPMRALLRRVQGSNEIAVFTSIKPHVHLMARDVLAIFTAGLGILRPSLRSYKRLASCFFTAFFLIFATACSDDSTRTNSGSSDGEAAKKDQRKVFISKGDLDDIVESGQIRLIAPRFDGADALPREGVSELDYQRLAERFATELGLDIKWVFVEGFDELISALNEGRGDIIITNLTVTKARSALVNFSRPIAQVSEYIVSKKSAQLDTLDKVKESNVSLAAGTSYIETAQELGVSNVEILPGATSTMDILTGIEEGQFQATILDSDVAHDLLPTFSNLKTGLELKKHRAIAWAVRKKNPMLLRSLNEFLVSHHVQESSNANVIRDWSSIKSSGRLRLLTLNNPASYFMWRGELMGFDYELLKKFTDKHDLHLAVVIKNSIPELFEAIKVGEGDVIAASITKSSEREKQGIVFSQRYLYAEEQIVGLENGPQVENIAQLSQYKIGVNPDTVFYERLRKLAGDEHQMKFVEFPGATTEELIDGLADKEYRFTIADSTLVSIEKSYHKNIAVMFSLSEKVSIAWGLRPDQQELLGLLNAFIKKEYRGLFYNVLFDKYFENERKIEQFQDGRVSSGQLSPYDKLIKKYAQKYKMDWRLITAQIYQESKFNPQAKSFAGALGLMQVMPRTARELGYKNVTKPELGIAAGLAYMQWVEERFPGELDLEERIYFTLAAYNAGTGHVRDARRLARQLGYNDKKWFDNVEIAMLKLSNPKYYKKARFGYVRGSEPVAYVREIRGRYLAYLNAEK